jgi:hypothetical protein
MELLRLRADRGGDRVPLLSRLLVRSARLTPASSGAHLADTVVVEERGSAVLRDIHTDACAHDDRLRVIHIHRLPTDEPDRKWPKRHAFLKRSKRAVKVSGLHGYHSCRRDAASLKRIRASSFVNRGKKPTGSCSFEAFS